MANKKSHSFKDKIKEFFNNPSTGFPEIIFNINNKGLVTFINQAKKGINLSKITGKSIYDLIPENSRANAKKAIKKVFSQGGSANYEHYEPRSKRTYINYVKPLKREGKVIGATIKSIDVTNFKKVENELKRERDWSNTLIKSAPNIIIGLGNKSEIILFNDFAEELTGYKASEVIGKRWIELFIPKRMKSKIYDVWNTIVSNKLIQHRYINPIIIKNGDKRLISWSNTVLTEHGKFKMVLSIGEDVTESKKAEHELRRSKNRFKQLYEYAPIPYHSLDSKGIIKNVNRSWCESLGFAKSEVIGKKIFDFVIPAERELSKTSFERKKKSNMTFIKSGHMRRYLCKDKSVKAFIINDFIAYNDDRSINAIHTTMQDVTDYERAKEDLKESEERLRMIIESANDAIMMIGPDKKICLWNNAAVKMFGYSKEEVIGKVPSFLMPEFFKDQFIKEHDYFINKGRVSVDKSPFEGELVKSDGSSFPAEFTVSPVKIGGRVHALLIIRNVTEHNEMQQMKAELEHKRELEQIKDDFLMMITHELKQPISPIMGFAELIKKQLSDEKLLSYLEAITSSAKNMRGSVMKILNLLKLETGKENFKFKQVNLNSIVKRVLMNKLGAAKLRDIRLINKFKDLLVNGNEELIEEVFNNLIDNAVKFSKRGGKVLLSNWIKDGFVFASVKDSGVGISPEEIPSLFTKFYQTENGLRVGGFGIGLSICDKIIKAHEGEIIVKSKLGKGSEFIVKLASIIP